MSVSADTPARLLLDVGTITVGGVDVGATGKEGSFEVQQEIYYPDLGGTLGRVAGTGKIISEIATLKVPMKEVDISKLVLAMPTLSSASDANSEYTTTGDIGYIDADLYVTVIWTGTEVQGNEVQIQLFNALPTGGLSLGLNDNEEATYEVTWQANHDMANPKQRCWQVLRAISA